jgi:hypothetical protein
MLIYEHAASTECLAPNPLAARRAAGTAARLATRLRAGEADGSQVGHAVSIADASQRPRITRCALDRVGPTRQAPSTLVPADRRRPGSGARATGKFKRGRTAQADEVGRVIHPLTWRRRLTQTALRLGAALLPAERLTWAAAMRAEAQHINDDREALHWALGSVCACTAERFRVLRVRRLFSTHSLGILWIVIFIVSSAFNVSIALAARLGCQRMASALGWWIREFQYDRFVPFAAAMPPGLFCADGFRGRVVQRVALPQCAKPPGVVRNILCRTRTQLGDLALSAWHPRVSAGLVAAAPLANWHLLCPHCRRVGCTSMWERSA